LQRCRWTQHIAPPGDEPVDHRAEALQFAPAIRARGDVRFGRGNLARRQCLSGVGAGYLALLAAVRLPDPGGMRGLHTPNTSNASFWIGPRRRAQKKALCRYARPHTPAGRRAQAAALWTG